MSGTLTRTPSDVHAVHLTFDLHTDIGHYKLKFECCAAPIACTVNFRIVVSEQYLKLKITKATKYTNPLLLVVNPIVW